MKPCYPPAWLFVLLLAISPSVLAQLVWVARDDTGQFRQKLSVDAGKILEVCEKLVSGDKVQWSFGADASLDFNIHYHEADKVLYSAREEQSLQARDTLQVSVNQDYCWMWRNRHDRAVEVTIDTRLER